MQAYLVLSSKQVLLQSSTKHFTVDLNEAAELELKEI